MAVDKKSDYVGNHGGAYTDNDGMSKQFTYIDHDVKTKIRTGSIDIDQVKKDLAEGRKRIEDDILALPASLAPAIFDDFRIRHDDKLEWRETMLRDPGVPYQKLYEIYTLTSNAMSLRGLI